jgi:hypothetical protein
VASHAAGCTHHTHFGVQAIRGSVVWVDFTCTVTGDPRNLALSPLLPVAWSLKLLINP